MIKEIIIENYKSIDKVKLDLGRFNVFIGENGAGKSNILEAISLAGAAQARKLDNEFLTSRGVRVTDPKWMRCAIKGASRKKPIEVTVKEDVDELTYKIGLDDGPYPKWSCEVKDNVNVNLGSNDIGSFLDLIRDSAKDEADLKKVLSSLFNIVSEPASQSKKKKKLSIELKEPLGLFKERLERHKNTFRSLADFIVYSPENTALRTFEKEGQIEPLGVNGEGILKLLTVFDREETKVTLNKVKDSLRLLGWFSDFNVVHGGVNLPSKVEICDRWLDEDLNYFDQKSANEGFLFLVFYFSLFSSELTPSFFAVDNIDASLNPKLCEHLTVRLSELAVEHNKQVILTTHNPSVLDGLDLSDPDQRLFTIGRGAKGQTRVRRIEVPEIINGHRPLRLSEAFIRGSLGGLPKGF